MLTHVFSERNQHYALCHDELRIGKDIFDREWIVMPRTYNHPANETTKICKECFYKARKKLRPVNRKPKGVV